MGHILILAWVVSVAAVIFSGVYDLSRIIRTIKWLKNAPTSHSYVPDEPGVAPMIVLLLPVLREQRVIGETLQCLARLRYPLERLRIIIITTEKERSAREEACSRLHALAADIAEHHLSDTVLLEKYLGVFSEDVLRDAILATRTKKTQEDVLSYLAELSASYPDTRDIVAEQIEQLNSVMGAPVFSHVHYPNTKGGVNQQLYYAMRLLPTLLGTAGVIPSETYITIYNADSRPHLDTLSLVASLYTDYQRRHGMYPLVLQQSALFTSNMDKMSSDARGLLLQAAAVLQTRWVLAHEIPRLWKQSISAESYRAEKQHMLGRILGSEFALCTGHGLFMRRDVVERLGIFDLGTVTDDLPWSFRLCIDHCPIMPIPLLEMAESPSTLRSLVIQKRGWFLGLTEYPFADAWRSVAGTSTGSPLSL